MSTAEEEETYFREDTVHTNMYMYMYAIESWISTMYMYMYIYIYPYRCCTIYKSIFYSIGWFPHVLLSMLAPSLDQSVLSYL